MRTHRFIWVVVVALLLQAGAVAAADSNRATTAPAGPQTPERTEALLAAINRFNTILAHDATDTNALQGRGEANFRLGRIDESVRDFDQVIKLAPASMPFNWQRGIALYYAGRLEDAVQQFERHQAVNPQDVENAAWHFLCLARMLGPKRGPAEAEKKLIPIEGDARVPLMKVHALYAGKATVKDVIDAANAGNPGKEALRTRLFYAHLYIALYHEGRGEAAEAREHMTLAAGAYSVDGYMGDVARVHAWKLATAGTTTTQPAENKR